jgi:hypothetical protein
MEQLIEFPAAAHGMFDAPLDSKGYCFCYQHDIDMYGYGPYGFYTERAETLLKKTFPSLKYWDAGRETLLDVEYPYAAGVYFFKNQPYLEALEKELQVYERALKTYSLRARYKKSEHAMEPIKPDIFMVSRENMLPANFIAKLLEQNCIFLLVYSLTPYTGQTIVLFDPVIRDRIHLSASHEHIPCLILDSVDQVKPW